MKWTMAILLILGFGFIAKVTLSEHDNSLNLSSSDKIVQKSANAALENLTKELGNDQIGKLNGIIILREFSRDHFQSNAEMRDVCATVKTCPIPLEGLYVEGLKRLDKAADFEAKEKIQAQLLKSDLPVQTKFKILSETMVGSTAYLLPPMSKMVDAKHANVGPDIEYIVQSSFQLRSLYNDPNQFFKVMMVVLAKSKDNAGKQMIVNQLVKQYPKYKSYLASQAHSLGVTLAEN